MLPLIILLLAACTLAAGTKVAKFCVLDGDGCTGWRRHCRKTSTDKCYRVTDLRWEYITVLQDQSLSIQGYDNPLCTMISGNATLHRCSECVKYHTINILLQCSSSTSLEPQRMLLVVTLLALLIVNVPGKRDHQVN